MQLLIGLGEGVQLNECLLEIAIGCVEFIMEVVSTGSIIFGGRECADVSIVFHEGGHIADLAMQLPLQVIVLGPQN